MQLPRTRCDCKRWLGLYLLLNVVVVAGCATVIPQQEESTDFRGRAQTQQDAGIRVSASVLSPLETKLTFDLSLAQKGIQPVWIEIENKEPTTFTFQLLSVDPNYFAPSEVAYAMRHRGPSSFEEKIDRMLESHIPILVPAQSTVSGFVFTSLDPGAKAFSVELLGSNQVRTFEFVQLVPGFELDFMRVDIEGLYQPDEVDDLDLAGLRAYLESLQCCVLGGDEKTPGDPLNLVVVGEGRHVLATLVRRGWDLTETMRRDTTWRTVMSSVFGGVYRTSPVSPLYLFGRSHDAALQKARGTVDERNHLRLWRAPVTLDGEPVWVGQISRDIGIKLTRKTLVTHKIDPVVDEARAYITLDLAASQSLRAIGHVKGVGESTREAPRYNYTDDPYYTDGLRVVLILAPGRVPPENIEVLPWETLESRIARP
ncbi:MAG: LssY C-terminal domain-containing protein [Anaerolineae bacterium]